MAFILVLRWGCCYQILLFRRSLFRSRFAKVESLLLFRIRTQPFSKGINLHSPRKWCQ
ncbi:unnamed protein product [Brassica rapa subsp. narinosa]